ncbi:MAG TPA: histidinol-phosphate transaminase [candidate division Zixibacteria bacterium]|nr:histidinol-phosphate transaminase [candidate division Zixibacteria bacterium]
MAKRLVRINRAVMDLEPYQVSNQKPLFMDKSETPLKLDWNESTVSPSPKVKEALAKTLNSEPLNWYPDVEATELRNRLQEYTKLPLEYISCFGGSDMALEYIARTYLEPGCSVLLSAPTYDNFRVYAQSTGATVVQVTYKNPFHPNAKTLWDSISAKTRLVYICNPNNPTGAMMSEKEIVRLLELAPQQMFVIDEAYYEFCNQSVSKLVRQYTNLIVVRSFSKAFGLASLRVGYILTDPANLEFIHRIKVGKNLNALAQIAAIAALDDVSYTEKYIREISESKKLLLARLRELGFEFHITPANFFLIRFKEPKAAIKFLEQAGIFARDRSTVPQLEGFVRITIGTPPQTERLLQAIAKLAGQNQTTTSSTSHSRLAEITELDNPISA